MRILTGFLALLLLSACGGTGHPVANASGRGTGTAQAYCLSKGYARDSYDYQNCYQNRPEVQAVERRGRLSNLAIIHTNRSQQVGGARSYPIE